MPYTRLAADAITRTLKQLHLRVSERFPDRGILQVCSALLENSEHHVERAAEAARPRTGLRAAIVAAALLGIAAIGFGVWQKARLMGQDTGELYSFEGVEAIANMTILVGAGLWFLLNLEARMKRERVLENLHELRSIAHVIDMHQLNKDPSVALGGIERTAHSPRRDLSPAELARYLDYCTEMLSLTGKLAALYMQGLRDPVVIQAVNEIEELTTALSGKIWQKISMLQCSPDVPGGVWTGDGADVRPPHAELAAPIGS